MRNEKKSIGMGDYQLALSSRARWLIVKVLSDRKMHQNKEIREKTKLSSKTLDKHLKQLQAQKLIQRIEDDQSGKYPHPVYYRAEPELVTYSDARTMTDEVIQGIEPALQECRDPLMLLDGFHAANSGFLLGILSQLEGMKDISEYDWNWRLELFAWQPYRAFTEKLVLATKKILNHIDTERLLIEQAKRNKTIAEMTLERLRKRNLERREHGPTA
jgi:DNA-binding HxlR family transcriptional regulator